MSKGNPFRVKLTTANAIKNLQREFGPGRFDPLMKGVAQDSLTWLQKRAIKNLYDGVAGRGRPQDHSRSTSLRGKPTTGLRSALGKRSNHEVGAHSIDFVIDSRISRDTPYYRVQDEGTNRFIGRAAPIGFRSGGKRLRASVDRQGKDAALRGGGKVIIHHGIRGYHYLDNTIDQFNKEKVFTKKLDQALAPLRARNPGMEIKVPK